MVQHSSIPLAMEMEIFSIFFKCFQCPIFRKLEIVAWWPGGLGSPPETSHSWVHGGGVPAEVAALAGSHKDERLNLQELAWNIWNQGILTMWGTIGTESLLHDPCLVLPWQWLQVSAKCPFSIDFSLHEFEGCLTARASMIPNWS